MINRIYFILILMLGVGSSNANPYSSYFTIQEVEKPELEECVEALSKGFIYEENCFNRRYHIDSRKISVMLII